MYVCSRYRDCVDKTVEENSGIFSLIQMHCHQQRAVKLFTNKISESLAGYCKLTCIMAVNRWLLWSVWEPSLNTFKISRTSLKKTGIRWNQYIPVFFVTRSFTLMYFPVHSGNASTCIVNFRILQIKITLGKLLELGLGPMWNKMHDLAETL